MSSTSKLLFHAQTQGQLTKYSSNNKIYNSKMSSTSTNHTNSNNSTSPLITRGQQLLLSSSNEEEDDEEASQIQLSTKRPSCSSQLTNNSNFNQTSIHSSNSNFVNSSSSANHRASLTSGNLYNSQPYSQTESQPNYYGQVGSSSTMANRFLDRSNNNRSQSNLGLFSTLNNKTSNVIEHQDHHYYEPMFSNNKIFHQQPDLPPLPPSRNHLTNLNNFNEIQAANRSAALNGASNFATLHHSQNYFQLSNSIQQQPPSHLATNYNTLNFGGKHTVISNLNASSTNLQHLNQFYSKKKLHR